MKATSCNIKQADIFPSQFVNLEEETMLVLHKNKAKDIFGPISHAPGASNMQMSSVLECALINKTLKAKLCLFQGSCNIQ